MPSNDRPVCSVSKPWPFGPKTSAKAPLKRKLSQYRQPSYSAPKMMMASVKRKRHGLLSEMRKRWARPPFRISSGTSMAAFPCGGATLLRAGAVGRGGASPWVVGGCRLRSRGGAVFCTRLHRFVTALERFPGEPAASPFHAPEDMAGMSS